VGGITDGGLDSGGTYAVIDDDMLVSGPGDVANGRLALSETGSRESIATFAGLHLIAHDGRAYVQSAKELAALDRGPYRKLARERAVVEAKRRKLKGRNDAESKIEEARLKQQVDKLSAEMEKCWLWRVDCDCPYALILSGRLLFAGGEDRVTAWQIDDGRQVWSAEVDGHAYGLAVAGGRLLVSTNQGTIHSFRHTADATVVVKTPARPQPSIAPRPPLPTKLDESLLAWWEFRPECVEKGKVRDLTGRAPAAGRAGLRLKAYERFDALELDGSQSLALGENLESPALPRERFTAEAWVRIDKPIAWGGVIGAFQDNGTFEKGWILGYQTNRFSFAVKTAARPTLNYMTAEATFTPGQWHHVAGTYDGTTKRLYMDGRLVASADDQAGPIDYAPEFFYDLGAYHDQNEFFPLTGAVHEIRVYARALSDEEIMRHYREKRSWFPVKVFSRMPSVVHQGGRSVEVYWASVLTDPAVVEYGTSKDALTQRVEATSVEDNFSATLTGLAHRRRYWYRVVHTDQATGARFTGPVLSFRSSASPFELPSPYPDDDRAKRCGRAAESILKTGAVDRGYCLLLEAGTGQLAYEIARRSELKVIGVERDAQKVAIARKRLSQVGLYGTRVVVHQGTLAELGVPKYFANLVVADPADVARATSNTPADVFRVLRPCGGVVCLGCPAAAESSDLAAVRQWLAAGKWEAADAQLVESDGQWAVVRRGRLPGAGQWTHGLADPANTACSQDRRVAGPFELQWFGGPGPRQMADRHHRAVAPLCKDGRLFVPGDQVVFAVDAYNGTLLWHHTIPGSRRLGAFLDASNMAVDDHYFYYVDDDVCHVFDVATGQAREPVPMPQLVADGTRHWGYLAVADELIVGSGRKPEAVYTEMSREGDLALWYDNMSLVTSDYLFALDRSGKERRWTYQSGTILNTTLTIGDGRVYFLESQSPSALANPLGRMPMRTFHEGKNFLVALDLATGKVVWKKEFDVSNCRLIAYINYAQGKLVVSGNKYVDQRLWYWFYGVKADSGELVWQRSHNSDYPPRGGHGEQNRHPTIVDDTVYTYPLAYKLHTGEPVEGWKFERRGHGCGNVSASVHHLFWRGGNPQTWDLRPGGHPSPINRVTRPGCWINIIPAEGMLLIPEASSGCTCSYPLQTSLAYVPVDEQN